MKKEIQHEPVLYFLILLSLLGAIVAGILFVKNKLQVNKKTDADIEKDCLVVANNIKKELWNSKCVDRDLKPLCKLSNDEHYKLDILEEDKFNQCLSLMVDLSTKNH